MIYHLWFLLIFLVVLQYRVPAFGRSLTAIANLSADVGSASGKIALASANVSEVAAAFVIALTSNTMSMADEAWHGVDLLQVHANCERGRTLIDDGYYFREFLESEGGSHLLLVPWDVRMAIADVVGQISPRMPYLEFHRHDVNLSSHYWEIHVECRLLRSGYTGILWKSALVNFTATWANPLWELAELSTDSEDEQIRSKIRAHLDGTFEFGRPFQGFNASEASAVPVLAYSRMVRYQRLLTLHINTFLGAILAPFG